MKSFLYTVSLFLSIFIFSGSTLMEPASGSRGSKPNIILIMADDLGQEALGCYGAAEYETPVLDGLAAAGLRFTQCHSQPICTPTRVQIMTGLYNNRNYQGFEYLDPGQVTFAQLVKKAGYATCISGKWQLNGWQLKKPGWDDLNRPAHMGFDAFCLWQVSKYKQAGERYADPLVVKNGNELPILKDQYGPDVFCDFILDFMEEKKDQPFLVYYPMVLVHNPFTPTPDSPEWRDPDMRYPMKRHAGDSSFFPDMVNYMDKVVGRIVQKVDELGLRENTVIMFTGDNGTTTNIYTRMVDGKIIQGGKGSMTDKGTHVPLIVSWPGTSPVGKTPDDLVDFSDMLPTICDLAGTKVPDNLDIDGRSLLPQLKGKKGKPRKAIFFHYWGERGRTPEGAREMARNHRYVLFNNGDFFDLENDIDQTSPLDVDKLSRKEKKIHKRLKKELESSGSLATNNTL
jgi:arylsulfatase A